jgi:Flp pilus assembly secretin CpaC
MWKTALVVLVLCAASVAVAQEQQFPQQPPQPVPIDPQHVVPYYPTPFSQPVVPSADNRDSKNMHLMQAADHLEAAGLDDEAKKIRQIMGSENSPSISVQISMIEVSLEKLEKMGYAVEKLVPNSPADAAYTGQTSSVKLVDLAGGVVPNSFFGMLKQDDQYFTFLKALDKDGAAKTLAAPAIITQSGREAYLHTHGHVPISIKMDVTPEEFDKLGGVLDNIKNVGTTIHVKPTVLDNQFVQVSVDGSFSEIDNQHAINVPGTSLPIVNKLDIKTTCKIKDGDVVILRGLSTKQSALIALIKAEIVKPMQTAAKAPRGLLE